MKPFLLHSNFLKLRNGTTNMKGNLTFVGALLTADITLKSNENQ